LGKDHLLLTRLDERVAERSPHRRPLRDRGPVPGRPTPHDADQIVVGQKHAAHQDRARDLDLVVGQGQDQRARNVPLVGETLGEGTADGHLRVVQDLHQDLEDEGTLPRAERIRRPEQQGPHAAGNLAPDRHRAVMCQRAQPAEIGNRSAAAFAGRPSRSERLCFGHRRVPLPADGGCTAISKNFLKSLSSPHPHRHDRLSFACYSFGINPFRSPRRRCMPGPEPAPGPWSTGASTTAEDTRRAALACAGGLRQTVGHVQHIHAERADGPHHSGR
jgi:hypothetical protein